MASRSRRTPSRGRGGRGGGRFTAILWAFVVAAIVFAFFQIPYDPGAKGIYEIAKSKAENVQKWVGGIAPSIADGVGKLIHGGATKPGSPTPNNGTPSPGNKPSTGAASPAAAGAASLELVKLGTLKVADAQNVAYNRSDWKHWINVRNCWTVREQVLADEAVPGSLVLKDSAGKPTANLATACSITSGKWVDPYGGKTYTNPNDLDIDHMVPLGYVAQHGGQSWDSAKKQSYANDLNYAGHLKAVAKGENRAKSDKGPGNWKPSDKNGWCVYAQDWVNISSTWNISVAANDASALKEMLATCK